eukprot:TRINITY_DN2969_c0_g1_i1.p1 TRINITY_DN2969_c0_g1~~TRINITY_DN2969_c0_g1_i1.p1  ORF type:complete len:187 (-),score=31.02 TRINITY_DN2969_c0_g1_i1:635-1195(-)
MEADYWFKQANGRQPGQEPNITCARCGETRHWMRYCPAPAPRSSDQGQQHVHKEIAVVESDLDVVEGNPEIVSEKSLEEIGVKEVLRSDQLIPNSTDEQLDFKEASVEHEQNVQERKMRSLIYPTEVAHTTLRILDMLLTVLVDPCSSFSCVAESFLKNFGIEEIREEDRRTHPNCWRPITYHWHD